MPEAVAGAPAGESRSSGGNKLTHPVVIAAATALVTTATPQAFAMVNTALHPHQLPADIQPLQDAKWDANPTCGVGQNLWHPRADNALIDATICPGTGDILVAVKDYHGKVTQYWPALAPVGAKQVAVNTLFAAPANAAIPPYPARASRTAAGQQTAQDVTCQVRIDSTHLKRRVHRPDGSCLDIVIDTSTGQTTQSQIVSCSAAC